MLKHTYTCTHMQAHMHTHVDILMHTRGASVLCQVFSENFKRIYVKNGVVWNFSKSILFFCLNQPGLVLLLIIKRILSAV